MAACRAHGGAAPCSSADLLGLGRLALGLCRFDGRLRLSDRRLGRVVGLGERGLSRGQLSLGLVVGALGLLDVGRRGALEIGQRRVGRSDRRLRRLDASAQRVDLALGGLQVGGVVAAQGGVRGFGAGQRGLVGVDGALGRLLDVVGRAFLERRQLGIGRVERVLGLLDGLWSAALEHQVELGLLGVQGRLGELDVFGRDRRPACSAGAPAAE